MAAVPPRKGARVAVYRLCATVCAADRTPV